MWIRLVRNAAAVFIFMGVLELCARVDDFIRWGAPLVGEYSERIIWNTDPSGPMNRPGSRYEKWEIDEYGFRAGKVSAEKASGTYRIIVMGASEMFGQYESTGMEMSAQLQGFLDEAEPGHYEVLNAARAGLNLRKLVLNFRHWLILFSPDLVIVYPSPSLYLDLEAPSGKFSKRGADTARGKFIPRLTRKVSAAGEGFLPENLKKLVRECAIWRARHRHPEEWVWKHAPTERVELFEQHLEEVISEVLAAGTRIILATHANRFSEPLDEEQWAQLIAWVRFFPRASPLSMLEMERECNDVVRRLGRERNVRVIDTAALVPKAPEYFADFAHFTDAGARVVASALATEVQAIARGRVLSPTIHADARDYR